MKLSGVGVDGEMGAAVYALMAKVSPERRQDLLDEVKAILTSVCGYTDEAVKDAIP